MTREITPEVLLNAYASGIFPMAESRDSEELYWFEPAMRGLLPLDGFHVPRRLQRTVLSANFKIRVDSAFRDVMLACAEPRPGHDETWINDRILDLYCQLYQYGFAHSVECWQDGRLVGGVYGVSIGAAFFGESMFSRRRDASKVALVHLAARLKAGSFLLFDTQSITDHLTQFGAFEVPKGQYRRLLEEAIFQPADFHTLPEAATPQEVLRIISLKT